MNLKKPLRTGLYMLGGAMSLMVLLTGCSSFNRDWKAATARPATSGTVTGPWKGSWLSDQNGHTGELRCIVSKMDNGDYQFRFKAVYWKIFRFSYPVEMPVTQTGDQFKFNGQEDLGWLAGGVYTYDGGITNSNFFATYKCKYDHGTFKMVRP